MSSLQRNEILYLFDVDGTLTKARSSIDTEIEEFLYSKVKPKVSIGIVGGSDLNKMCEQLNGEKILENFDFVFPENGLIHYENGKEMSRQSIQQHLGEEKLQRFINFVLKYLSQIKLPVKRGTFIEFRSGMLNISPIGRQCSREERNDFEKYDKEHKIRETMIKVLEKEFHDIDLKYSIGGQISFDVFPHGWDKTYCLNHVTKNHNFKEIHFFGDKIYPGGNDYEIYMDDRTIGHKVESPDDTKNQLIKLLQL